MISYECPTIVGFSFNLKALESSVKALIEWAFFKLEALSKLVV